MGDVIVVLRIMPNGPENVEQIKAEAKRLNPQRLEEEPIAFGIKAIKFTTIIPDAEGELERLENKLRSIKNVHNIDVLIVSRSL